jgi:hypothetical protein
MFTLSLDFSILVCEYLYHYCVLISIGFKIEVFTIRIEARCGVGSGLDALNGAPPH